MDNENRTLLIIDDIDENREILERKLLKAGYRVETAKEGREGLEKLNNDLIDLVLLDIRMPVMDGITLLKKIRKEKLLADVPVIMVTAIEDKKTAIECLKSGACGYITKPFNMEHVNQQIRHCLGDAGFV